MTRDCIAVSEAEDNRGDKGIVKRFLVYFRPYKPQFVFVLIAAVFVALADSMIAFVGKLITDLFSGITQSQATGGPIEIHFYHDLMGKRLYDFTITGPDEIARMLWIIAGASIFFILLKAILHFAKEYMMWGVTHRVIMEIKRQLFSRIVHFPLRFFDQERSGDVVSRVTYDVTQIESSIRSAVVLIKSFVYAIVFVIGMFLMEWSLTIFVLAVFPVSGYTIKYFGDRIRRISRRVSLNVADYTAFLNEAIAGLTVIKAFTREREKELKFNEKIKENFRYNMKIAKLNTLHSPVHDLSSAIGMAGVILFCGYRILYGGMTFGNLTGFVLLLINAYKPIKALGEANTVLQRALASGRRIFNLLDQPDELAEIGSGTQTLTSVEGTIAFKKVSFNYSENKAVLHDIDLTIAAGETIALVGPSGGGKSTLMSLIPRFYPIRQGCIELDGTDIARLDLTFLRQQIAYVTQETVLFSGSVVDNIRIGDPLASEEAVIRAARASYSHDFIVELPNGYETEVGERGVQLSGGQRQRIAIARAILHEPRILLLDEATSSLDSESEYLIQQALDEFRRNRTTIMIAHRLSTVQSADRIAVIDNGALVEIGTHTSLYKAGGMYRRFYDQQFGADL